MKKIALLVFAIAVIIGIYFSGIHKLLTLSGLQSMSGDLQSYVAANPFQSVLVAFFVMTIVYMLPLPTAALMSIAAGFMFNFTTGLLLVLISSLIAASITFLVARYIARDWIKEKFAKYMTAVDGEVEAHGFSNALGIRMIPGIPFIALNSTLGVTKLPLKVFCLSTVLGMIPISAILVNAGSQLNEIQSMGDILTPQMLLSLLLLASFPFLIRFLKTIFNKYSLKK